jgi:hypothetical protein
LLPYAGKYATASRLDAPIEDELLLPVQYAALVRGDRQPAPEHRLLWAVLEDAVRCWQIHERRRTTRDRRLFGEVAEWFASDDDGSPFSFIAICQLFGLDPSYLRAGLQRWSDRRRATGGRVVPFRVRRISGLRHTVTAADRSAR